MTTDNAKKVFEKVYDILMKYDNRLTRAFEYEPEKYADKDPTDSETKIKPELRFKRLPLEPFESINRKILDISSENSEFSEDISKIWEFCYKTLVPRLSEKQKNSLACPYTMDFVLSKLDELYLSLRNPEILNCGMVYLLFKHCNERHNDMFKILPWFKDKFKTVELSKKKDYFFYSLLSKRTLGTSDIDILDFLIVEAGWGIFAGRVVDMLNEHGFENFEGHNLLYYLATEVTSRNLWFLNEDIYSQNQKPKVSTPPGIIVSNLESTIKTLEEIGVRHLAPRDSFYSARLASLLVSMEIGGFLPENLLPTLLKKGLKPGITTLKKKNESVFLSDLLTSSVLMDYFSERLFGENEDPILESLLKYVMSYGKDNFIHTCESTGNPQDCLFACKQIIDYFKELDLENKLPSSVKKSMHFKKIFLQWEKILDSQTAKFLFTVKNQEKEDSLEKLEKSIDYQTL